MQIPPCRRRNSVLKNVWVLHIDMLARWSVKYMSRVKHPGPNHATFEGAADQPEAHWKSTPKWSCQNCCIVVLLCIVCSIVCETIQIRREESNRAKFVGFEDEWFSMSTLLVAGASVRGCRAATWRQRKEDMSMSSMGMNWQLCQAGGWVGNSAPHRQMVVGQVKIPVQVAKILLASLRVLFRVSASINGRLSFEVHFLCGSVWIRSWSWGELIQYRWTLRVVVSDMDSVWSCIR